ncbi:MAG TPA: hypothetical protein VMZ00_05945 [Sporichthya sp.]|nr:hypothetical protein [Sporichthya sp.]
MGVIKRFAVSSMVLGVLAMAGGASAFAFNGSSTQAPAVRPADARALPLDLASDVPPDVPSEQLPDTGGSDSAWRWLTPHGR